MSRRAWVVLALQASLLLPAAAGAQVVQRCQGQTFADLAGERLGDPRLGPVVAAFNGQPDADKCTAGRFVRFPATIRHEVRLGQTVENIAARFTRAPGGAALIRARNGLPAGTEPDTGMVLEVPAELTLKLGTRPEEEVKALFGLPPLEEIRTYNAAKTLPRGSTVYVPLFFELLPLGGAVATAPPPPTRAPPPPTGMAPPPPVVDPATVPDAIPHAPTSTVQADLQRVVKVAATARYDGFLHPIHQAVLQDSFQCALCHAADPRKPMSYLPVPGALCGRCHARVEEGTALRAQALTLDFSHDLHLSAERKVRKDGYELACADCHKVEEGTGRRGTPGHAECARCHNPKEAHPTVVAECSGCHGESERMDRRMMAQALLAEHYRASVRGTDLVFGHDEHVAQLGGEAGGAACDRCHAEARTADDLEVIEPQRMADCMACHRGMARELAGVSRSLDRCRTCHLATRAEVAPVFGAVIDKPLSHSRTFRRRHAEQARADDGVCAACHTELAGGAGRECNACHTQIRPQDHTVRWRELPHGRSAVRDPDRCATCHLKDRCADCHAQPPRDHFPRGVFQVAHGRRARISTRRCLTCHVPQVDCARCHDVTRQ
ncbi:MAG: hypothetical protein H6730_09410 [Deltaproteobacteria bacterium]|nr:hypothetical protein [Deltaproteobacteria bacterium]